MVARSEDAPPRGPLRAGLRWLFRSRFVPVALALGVYFAWEPVASRQLWSGETFAFSLAGSLRWGGLGVCLLVGFGSLAHAMRHARAGRQRERLASLGCFALVALPWALHALDATPIADALNRRRFAELRPKLADAGAGAPQVLELPGGRRLQRERDAGAPAYTLASDTFNRYRRVLAPSEVERARAKRLRALGDGWWLVLD
ncbi:MAG: hypothetical protein H6828_01860 [Planctomycetes bacterium]|nr:hypothetical protein [Planctomycetota bacterium]